MKSKYNYPNEVLRLMFFMLVSFCCIQRATAQPFNLSKAEKEIEARLRDYEKALKNGDSIALGNMYTADAELFSNGGPSTIGRGNLITAFSSMIRDSITGSGFKTTGLWGNADMLVEEGTGYFSHANGKKVSSGKYLLVWKKDEGQWKIFKDTFFSDGTLKKKSNPQ
ncbi:MAG: nuclear transport factor 2 family protein [Ferruginibacter sp.]